jgi:hypothetical protein
MDWTELKIGALEDQIHSLSALRRRLPFNRGIT